MMIENIFEEIRAERRRQDEKFGEQNCPMIGESLECNLDEYEKFPPRSMLSSTLARFRHRCETDKHGWYDILFEEVLEAFIETETEKQREEMVQVAAVSVAIIEYLDRMIKKERQMKCLCGYNGEDFKLAEPVEVYEPGADVENTNGENSQVWVCPKCGTLKVEV